MRVCIHRGTKEIGGTCVEIESDDGSRIVLDVGLPLDCTDPDSLPLHRIKGFQSPHPSLLGVIISHPHQDHYGLAHRLPKETLFLIGKAAEAILDASAMFSPAGLKLARVRHLINRTPMQLGPFTITPYLVDHSAYDSYAVLVEADGKRLFYSGDFRVHGWKSRLVEELIKSPPPDVDALLMEGTCIGRPDANRKSWTEEELVPRLRDIFRQTQGMPLVWCSGQNIDRITTVMKACNKAGRTFIIDVYTAEVLRATGNKSLPQGCWDGIRVFLPASQRRRIIKSEAFDIADRYRPYRIFPEKLADVAGKSVMLFRPSMTRDLERAGCLKGGTIICSVWAGYLKNDKNHWFVGWLKEHDLPVRHCHTSGHAFVSGLGRLRDAFEAATVVPVHLEDRNLFLELFDKAVLREDDQWWSVEKPMKYLLRDRNSTGSHAWYHVSKGRAATDAPKVRQFSRKPPEIPDGDKLLMQLELHSETFPINAVADATEEELNYRATAVPIKDVELWQEIIQAAEAAYQRQELAVPPEPTAPPSEPGLPKSDLRLSDTIPITRLRRFYQDLRFPLKTRDIRTNIADYLSQKKGASYLTILFRESIAHFSRFDNRGEGFYPDGEHDHWYRNLIDAPENFARCLVARLNPNDFKDEFQVEQAPELRFRAVDYELSLWRKTGDAVFEDGTPAHRRLKRGMDLLLHSDGLPVV
jgi:ribonuclease J